jgi:hypothetical protein
MNMRFNRYEDSPLTASRVLDEICSHPAITGVVVRGADTRRIAALRPAHAQAAHNTRTHASLVARFDGLKTGRAAWLDKARPAVASANLNKREQRGLCR